MKKLLHEPVFHFALLGIVLFGYFSLVSDDRPVTSQSNQVAISDAELRQLIEQYKSVWYRPPSDEELTALIDGAVREEVLVREARALGLDRGDTAIRMRLNQKMQFLIDSAAQMLEPDDDSLRTYMQNNPDQFMRPAKVAFEQIYLGESTTKSDVNKVQAQLAEGAAPQSLGRRGMLPTSVTLVTKQQVDNTFGTGFFTVVSGAEPGVWSDPVRSGFGWHLVRVSELQPAEMAEFSAARDSVLSDWRRGQAKILAAAQYKTLQARYEVMRPDAAARKEALSR